MKLTQADLLARDPLLGPGEIAALLQVNPVTVSNWRRHGIFPDPDWSVRVGDLWFRSTVRTWAERTGRWPYTGDAP